MDKQEMSAPFGKSITWGYRWAEQLPLRRWPVLHLSCETYRAIRQALGVRRKFFNDLQALTRYLYFDSWQQLLTYMFQGLELELLLSQYLFRQKVNVW